MPQNAPKDERWLLRVLDQLERRLKALETAPRAGNTSLSHGKLLVMDPDTGNVIASMAGAAGGTDLSGNPVPAGLGAQVGSVNGGVLQPASVDATKVSFTMRDLSGITTTTSATAPAAPVVGDLWIDTGNGNLLKRWDGSAWAALPVGTGGIAAQAVTASQIAANTITAGQIAAGAITAAQIAANTITAGQIAANTITAGQIAANTITAAQIAANTITASQLAANSVTAAQIAAGAIDGETITGATLIADGTTGGMFVYSGPPAAGNLIAATAPHDGTDAYGNTFAQGVYVSGYMDGGTVNALTLQPKNAAGSNFVPGQLFTRTYSTGENQTWLVSPYDQTKGSDTAAILLHGADVTNGGLSSIYLDADKLLVIGAGGSTDISGPWLTYVPTWTGSTTNPTIGNGTITGRYMVIGETCHVAIRIALGTTSTVGSGTYLFGLPFTSANAVVSYLGTARYVTGGASSVTYIGQMTLGANSAVANATFPSQSTLGVAANMTAAAPAAPPATAIITMSLTYQTA